MSFPRHRCRLTPMWIDISLRQVIRRSGARAGRRARVVVTTVVVGVGAALGPATALADSCAGQPGCPYSSVVSILPRPLPLGPLAVSARGDVFALASGNNAVIHLTPADQITGVWNTPGRAPLGIATDAAGSTVFVTDSDLGNVAVFLSTGAFRGTFGSEGTGTGQLVDPVAIARDAGDNVYVGDLAHGIQKFGPSRKVVAAVGAAPGATSLALAGPKSIVLAGSAPGLPGVARYTTALAPTATFALPAGIGFPQVAVDSIGDIYVSDQISDNIYQYDAGGKLLSVFGGPGTTLGSLLKPSGLAIDGSDNLYVSDTGNARIQKFALVPAASATLAPRVAFAGRRTPRLARLRVHCEARGTARCAGTLRVLESGRKVGGARFSLRDGATRTVGVRIGGRAGRLLARGDNAPVEMVMRCHEPGRARDRTLRRRQVLRAPG